MTVEWEADIQPDVRAAVEPVLLRWGALVPTWVQRFIVRFEPAREAEMAVQTSYRGRWAVLIATGRWFDEPPHEREDALIHELVHICLEPLVTVCARIIEDCTPEGTPLRELADSTFTDGMEASVEDLARCISRIPRECACEARRAGP